MNAKEFCTMAHESIQQKRKYTNDPYYIHPCNVAYLVDIAGGTQDMINAAYLHDVIEDVMPLNPLFDVNRIIDMFGSNVSDLVLWLTDVKHKGNREQRKKLQREDIAQAPIQAKTIKLADLIDNSLTITKYDQNFSKVYLKEKRLLLEVLKDGDKGLWNMANDILIRNGY